MKQLGADDFYRKKLLGHASKTVTDDVYTHSDTENLLKTIELLSVNNVCSLYAVEKKTQKTKLYDKKYKKITATLDFSSIAVFTLVRVTGLEPAAS